MSLKINNKLVVSLAFLVAPAWAGTVCSGSTSLATIAACEQGDKKFSAFSYFDNGGTGPAASNIFVTFNGTAPTGPITDSFTSSGWILNTANAGSSVFLYNYTQVDQVSNPGFVLTGFDLQPGTVTLPATCASGTGFCDAIQIITTFCTNLATNTCTSADANYGQFDYVVSATNAPIQEFCYATCSGGVSVGATSIGFSPALGITSIFVTNEVIVNNYDSKPGGISGFANDYFEQSTGATPEPGTFYLLGLALGTAGVVKLKAWYALKKPCHVSSLP